MNLIELTHKNDILQTYMKTEQEKVTPPTKRSGEFVFSSI